MRLGVIGLGVMGMPIARHLKAEGVDVVGYDVEDRAMAGFVALGGAPATSAREVAERVELVLTLLPSARALADVVAGLAKAGGGARVDAECSRLPIATKIEARDLLASVGVDRLHCPLSGTGAQAEKRDLVVLASGPRAGYERALETFQTFSRAQKISGRLQQRKPHEIRRQPSGEHPQRRRR